MFCNNHRTGVLHAALCWLEVWSILSVYRLFFHCLVPAAGTVIKMDPSSSSVSTSISSVMWRAPLLLILINTFWIFQCVIYLVLVKVVLVFVHLNLFRNNINIGWLNSLMLLLHIKVYWSHKTDGCVWTFRYISVCSAFFSSQVTRGKEK